MSLCSLRSLRLKKVCPLCGLPFASDALSCAQYGLVDAPALARWQTVRLDRMGAVLERDRLDGHGGFLLAVLRAMVRHGKKERGRRAGAVLVAEPPGLAPPAVVRALLRQEGRRHLRLRRGLDSVHAQPDHSLPPQGS